MTTVSCDGNLFIPPQRLKQILPEDRVHGILDLTGFPINRTGVQLTRCRPFIQKMIESTSPNDPLP
jgi:hypothetical protein